MYKLFNTTQDCVEFIMKWFGLDELEASHAAVWASKYIGPPEPEWKLDLRELANFLDKDVNHVCSCLSQPR